MLTAIRRSRVPCSRSCAMWSCRSASISSMRRCATSAGSLRVTSARGRSEFSGDAGAVGGELVQPPPRPALGGARVLPAGAEQAELLEPAQRLVQRAVAGQRSRAALLAHRLRETEAVERRLPRVERRREDLALQRQQGSRLASRHRRQE
jgi:hypothetical protein